MFNPIENIWSVVKSWVKINLVERLRAILNGNTEGLSVIEFRLRALEDLIWVGLRQITVTLCSNCISRIQGLVSDALNLIDMQF